MGLIGVNADGLRAAANSHHRLCAAPTGTAHIAEGIGLMVNDDLSVYRDSTGNQFADAILESNAQTEYRRRSRCQPVESMQRTRDVMAIGLMTTALAGALLAALFFALKPRASTRAARWRAAVVLFAAALAAGAAAYSFAQGETPLLRVASALGIAVAGVTVLIKGRQPLR